MTMTQCNILRSKNIQFIINEVTKLSLLLVFCFFLSPRIFMLSNMPSHIQFFALQYIKLNRCYNNKIKIIFFFK